MQCCKGSKCCHFHCKGSSAVNVVHNFQGSCGACKGSKCCNFQGLSILQFPGFCACKGSKCYLVRVCACRNSKCFNFQDLAIFKVFCMQGSIYLQFPGILCHAGARRVSLSRAVCARKGSKCCSKCFTFQGFCARKGSTCFNLLFRKLPANWAPKNTKWYLSLQNSLETTLNIGPKLPWTS